MRAACDEIELVIPIRLGHERHRFGVRQNEIP